MESPLAYNALGDDTTPSAVLRSSSSHLLRAASSTMQFTGGATVIPPSMGSGDDSTRRTRTLRRASRSTVQQRMMEDVWSRYQFRISIFIFTLVIFSFTMILLFYQALFAVLSNFSQPCDQPLNYYLATSFVVGQITPQIVKFFQRMRWAQGPRTTVAISMAGSIPGWITIAWGFLMVNSCKTCQETNPGLFYPTKNFIFGQVVLFVLTTVFFSVGFTGVLAYWSTLPADGLRPGCEEAVRKLTKVPLDAPELIDEEDGHIMECAICWESFADKSTVVRTSCSHHFHEECLLKWCRNHLDCPLCRASIGEASCSP